MARKASRLPLDHPYLLLVKDSQNVSELTDRVLDAHPSNLHRFVRISEDEVTDFLMDGSRFGGRDRQPLPAAVLLDLDDSVLTVAGALNAIRGSELTRLLPVVVLTGRTDRQEAAETYEAGATSYLRKPDDQEHLARVLEQVVQYWLSLNVPPPFPPVG